MLFRSIASAEVVVEAELLLDPGIGGVLPQAGCDLSAVLDRKQTEVAVGGVGAGRADLGVGCFAPTLMGIPSFRQRRVPMWKGFSFRDLAMWAWKGPEMYAVTKESPLWKRWFGRVVPRPW